MAKSEKIKVKSQKLSMKEMKKARGGITCNTKLGCDTDSVETSLNTGKGGVTWGVDADKPAGT